MSKSSAPPPPYSVAPPVATAHPTATVVITAPQVGPQPATLTCPACRASIQTKVNHEAATKTHLFALLLCLLGCWCCCCIPYCMDSCQNANHYCPNCGAFIGSYNA